MTRLALALTMLAIVAGCRNDVEGDWEGYIDGGRASLDLQQKGEVLEGTVCWQDLCDDIRHGTVIEEAVTIEFGCSGHCPLPDTELILTLSSDGLAGDAAVDGASAEHGCDCEPDHLCSCRLSARFNECSGSC